MLAPSLEIERLERIARQEGGGTLSSSLLIVYCCRLPIANCYNIVLLFAAAFGIGWITSQCSTTLPSSNLKIRKL